MFIMGSGGHTTEIISMIEHSIRPSPGTFRRYIVNEDDGMTKRRILDLEKRIGDRLLHLGEEPGLFDVLEVKRARKVHQSWMSTPYTAVMSIVSIAKILFQECPALMEKRRPDWRFPKVVVTNGPGTGFLVLAVIHFCKMVSNSKSVGGFLLLYLFYISFFIFSLSPFFIFIFYFAPVYHFSEAYFFVKESCCSYNMA